MFQRDNHALRSEWDIARIKCAEEIISAVGVKKLRSDTYMSLQAFG
jgi:hypothetical protein